MRAILSVVIVGAGCLSRLRHNHHPCGRRKCRPQNAKQRFRRYDQAPSAAISQPDHKMIRLERTKQWNCSELTGA